MKKDSSKIDLQKFGKQALTKNQKSKVKGGTEPTTDDSIVTTDAIIL